MKTGLTQRAATKALSNIFRLYRKKDMLGVSFAVLIAVLVVVVVALILQGLEVQYAQHTLKAKEWIESADIKLPSAGVNIELTKYTPEESTGVVLGAQTQEYEAQLVSQNATVVRLDPRKALTLEARFKNVGTATWTRNGAHFVAMNVAEPAGRTSAFRHSFWKEYFYRPTRLLEESVAPGEIGTFRFAVQAPDAPGRTLEHFALVAEDLLWIPGGQVVFTMEVQNPYKAELVDEDSRLITLDPGKALTLEARFKNVGTATWTRNGAHFVAMNVAEPAGRTSAFRHSFWKEYFYRPTRLLEESVAPGEIGTFRFAVQAPSATGLYTEAFGLVAEDYTWIEGGRVRFRFRVGTGSVFGEEVVDNPPIRVGLTKTDQPITLYGTEGVSVSAGGEILTEIPAGETLTLTPSGRAVDVSAGELTVRTEEPVRMTAPPDGVVVVSSYTKIPGWSSSINDNVFRGTIEVRYSTRDRAIWIINELPLEDYLAGIAETSSGNPKEYVKALTVAARSYAYYHLTTRNAVESRKHAGRGFHVHTTYDQVYRGYNVELRAPDIREAVEATRGIVVTYNDEPVITPYFSHSDGRTRSWEDVWYGGPFPWLTSVPDPHNAGMTLYGHGVGMSALGALLYAREDGWTMEQILAHYYQNTGLMKLYE